MSFWEDLKDACQEVADYAQENKSLIFLVTGITLGIGATVVAVSEGKKADEAIKEKHEEEAESEEEISKPKQIATDIVTAAPYYWGAVVLWLGASFFLIKSYKISAEQIGALTTAVGYYRRRSQEYDVYRQKVREVVGKNKEEKIATETQREIIKQDPPASEMVALSGDGKQLMYIVDTGTYIRSTPNDIRNAEKIITHRLSWDEFASLYDLLYEADVVMKEKPPAMDLLGWQCGSMTEAVFKPHLMEDGVTTITGVQFFEDDDDMLNRIIAGRSNR